MTGGATYSMDRKPERVWRAPAWGDVLVEVREALASRGIDETWWSSRDDVLRQTVLNLYGKLVLHGLWRFVAREDDSGPGAFHFEATDVVALRAHLKMDAAFTAPSGRGDGWQSRERSAKGTLHFKHFDGWPEGRVQAHVDAVGLGLSCGLWLTGVAPVVQLVRHCWINIIFVIFLNLSF